MRVLQFWWQFWWCVCVCLCVFVNILFRIHQNGPSSRYSLNNVKRCSLSVSENSAKMDDTTKWCKDDTMALHNDVRMTSQKRQILKAIWSGRISCLVTCMRTCVWMKTLLLFNQVKDRAEAKTISKTKTNKEKMSRAFSGVYVCRTGFVTNSCSITNHKWAMWLCDCVTVWLCDCVTVLQCDCVTVTVWLCDCATVWLWLCDCVTVWQCLCVCVSMSVTVIAKRRCAWAIWVYVRVSATMKLDYQYCLICTKSTTTATG